jgi:precorrin-6B methylase 2
MKKPVFNFLFFGVFLMHYTSTAQQLDVPFVATPHEVVEEMLNMAGAGPGDYVIDLGSGDGRIVIAAAKRGAVGHGIDLDPDLVEQSRRNAQQAGVNDRVSFWVENVYDTDYSMATVITMYLLTSINVNLKPDFLKKLKPGTRIVSHVFDMRNWQPDRREQINYHNIYLWIIPANVEGEWHWDTEKDTIKMIIEQSFQEITTITLLGKEKNESEWCILEAYIHGDRITIIAESKSRNIRHVYHGIVNNDFISGTVQIHEESGTKLRTWNARRT